MADKYLITTYPQAIQRIREFGYLWDIGQISQPVLNQLHWAVKRGEIRITTDGWPLRGEGGKPEKLFELTDWGKKQIEN